MSKKIYFDLDGTLYDLYNIENWLEMLRSEQSGAFLIGQSLVNLNDLNLCIQELVTIGYTFGIISWLPMQATPEYEEICRREKIVWITENLPFISETNIISYGVLKQTAIQKKAQTMYLIDDSIEVCKAWETAKQRRAININDSFTAIDALNSIIEME